MRLSANLRKVAFAAVLWLGALLSTPAAADDVVIKRDVAVHQEARKTSRVLASPPVGSALPVLDNGQQSHGYFHVQLSDGRTGWVYRTFVGLAPSTASALGPDQQMAVHYINVDQGAAALIEFPCAAIMIDVGGRGDVASAHLIAYLDAFFQRRPDLNHRLAAIFITHTHVDHNSNLKAVAQRYGVGGYIHNGVLHGSGRSAARWMVGAPNGAPGFAMTTSPRIPVREVAEEDVSSAGSAGLSDAIIDPVNCPQVDPKIRVLSGRYDDSPGWTDTELDNGNNQSLVVRIDFGAASFLFTGDMEEPALDTLVERMGPTGLLDADVWEVGHHGSANGLTEDFLKRVSPKVAVISMGSPAEHQKWTAWAYGHPRRTSVTLVDRYTAGHRNAAAGVLVADKVKAFTNYTVAHAVYGTGWDGDVSVAALSDGQLTITTGQ